MLTFTLGIASIAVLLGFLVGASNSPVAGVAITATFGIVAAALAFYQKSGVEGPFDPAITDPKKMPAPQKNTVDAFKNLGRVLAVFSIAFFAGLGCGVYVKLLPRGVEAASAFPWQGVASPASARTAIDWILVQRHLRSFGYIDTQIAEIYKLHLKESADTPVSFRSSQLLSPLFLGQSPSQSPTATIAEGIDRPGVFRYPGLIGEPG